TRISSAGDFLSTVPSYTLIKEPLRRMCHRLVAFSIVGRGQTPEKVFFRGKQGAKMSVVYCMFRSVLWSDHRVEPPDIDSGERQQDRAVARAAHIDPEVAQEGAPADPTPIQPQQMPQAADPAPRTMPQRMQRLKEEVHRLRESLREQQVLLKRVSGDQERVTTWVVDRITRLMQ
ncbi:hypothetical protein Tco_0080732, partial [Tanacetum coccineum]